eukprot:jgi/Bigna1/136409/aug1.33_g11117
MPALSVTDWTLLAILIPALALFYVLLVFVKHYRNAWLKMIVICSYIAAILLTAVQIIMVAFVPASATQIHYTAVVTTGLSILMLTRLFHKAVHVVKTSVNLGVERMKNKGSMFSRPSSLHSSRGFSHARAVSKGPTESRNSVNTLSRVDTQQRSEKTVRRSTVGMINEVAEQNLSKVQPELKSTVV